MVRTRFAPSPTGFMHIGGVRTALYAYLIAKQHDGKFILRIEDTDQSRFVEGAIDVIYSSLRELGLIWDEGPDVGGDYGPYIQSERKDSYMDYALKLIEEGKAYYCFCSDEDKVVEEGQVYRYDRKCRDIELAEAKKRAENEEFVIRFKMPLEGNITFTDAVYGEITVESDELEDLIMIKSDGMPTYNFANIIDDYEMGISHIVRGNEYVSSTPKYIQIYNALGFEVPEFIHLPIIKKEAGSDKKLSKRDNDATVDSLKNNGYLNKAIINMLALTGWSPGGEQELFTLEELVKEFNVEGISKGNAIFDTEKLKWMNNHYIKELSEEETFEFFKPFLAEAYDLSNVSDEWVTELAMLYRDRISYGREIIAETEVFFKESIELGTEEAEFIAQDGVNELYVELAKNFSELEDFSVENINATIKTSGKAVGSKGKMLFMPTRIAITGEMHGPDLVKSIFLLGQDTVVSRLSSQIK